MGTFGETKSPATAARKMGSRIVQPERELPVLAETEVLVVGGGPAGVCAAIAAARHGAHTTLVERYGHLGGLASGGLVLYLDGYGDKERQWVCGLGGEIRERLLARDAFVPTPPGSDRPHDGTCDPEALKQLLLEMLLEAKANLFLHAWSVEAILEERRTTPHEGGSHGSEIRNVVGAVVESKSGRGAALAKVVVDASGDGDIFASAGASYENGLLGIGLPYRLGNVDLTRRDQFRRENPEEWKRLNAACVAEGGWSLPGGGRTPAQGVVWVNNTLDVMDGLDIRDLTRAELECRRRTHKTVGFLKKHRVPGYENACLLETAPQLGVRQTRQLRGEHFMSLEEFHDAPVHHPDAILHGAAGCRVAGGWSVPYRALVPKDPVENLLAAGRCVANDARSPLRVIPFCFGLGHAAGTAAALALRQNVPVRQVNPEQLRARLREEGAFLR